MPIAYPYKFSDWYGYDKDCSTVTQFDTTTVARNACSFSSSNNILYHDGSNPFPVVGDIVYSNSAGTTKVAGGERRNFNSGGTGFGTYTVNFAPIGGSNTGVVGSVDICVW